MKTYPVKHFGAKQYSRTEPKKDKNFRITIPTDYEVVISPQKKKMTVNPPEIDEYVPSHSSIKPENSEKEDSADNIQSESVSNTTDTNTELSHQDTNSDSSPENDEPENISLSKFKKVVKLSMTFIMSILSVLGVKEGKDFITEYNDDDTLSAVIDFDSEKESISSVAEIYNIPEEIIKFCNNIHTESDLKQAKKLSIPSEYDYLDDIIKDTQEKLYKHKNKNDSLYDTSNNLDFLIKKQEEQKDLADMYIDGETVYISIKDFSENPELASKYGANGISCDYLEHLFDIDEGVLDKYNSFVSWEALSQDSLTGENKYFKDYDEVFAESGTTVKVPLSAIDTKDIEIESYSKD